jgi:ribosome-binding protein aMBF1 (putative translation factor)
MFPTYPIHSLVMKGGDEMEACECCGRSMASVQWYLLDENAEVTLCKPCAKAMTSEMSVERIPI